MKPHYPDSISQHAATLLRAASMCLIALAVLGIAAFAPAFSGIPFSRFLSLAACLVPAGMVMAAACLAMRQNQFQLQQRARHIRARE